MEEPLGRCRRYCGAFNIGKLAIGLYLGNSSVGSAYGAAGSLVVVLIWVFYSAQILLIGAEFTQVYSKYRGMPLRPSKHAVPIDEKRAIAHSSMPISACLSGSLGARSRSSSKVLGWG